MTTQAMPMPAARNPPVSSTQVERRAEVAAVFGHARQREAENDQDHHQVVDAFEKPGRELRGEGYALAHRDEVGPNQFAGTAEESHGSEADAGGGNETPEMRVRLEGPEHDAPAQRAYHVGQQNHEAGQRQPERVERLVGGEEDVPTELAAQAEESETAAAITRISSDGDAIKRCLRVSGIARLQG